MHKGAKSMHFAWMVISFSSFFLTCSSFWVSFTKIKMKTHWCVSFIYEKQTWKIYWMNCEWIRVSVSLAVWDSSILSLNPSHCHGIRHNIGFIQFVYRISLSNRFHYALFIWWHFLFTIWLLCDQARAQSLYHQNRLSSILVQLFQPKLYSNEPQMMISIMPNSSLNKLIRMQMWYKLKWS